MSLQGLATYPRTSDRCLRIFLTATFWETPSPFVVRESVCGSVPGTHVRPRWIPQHRAINPIPRIHSRFQFARRNRHRGRPQKARLTRTAQPSFDAKAKDNCLYFRESHAVGIGQQLSRGRYCILVSRSLAQSSRDKQRLTPRRQTLLRLSWLG